MTAASVSKTHLALVNHAHTTTKKIAVWRAWLLAICVVPWALFLLWTATPQMWASIKALEIFSEGLTLGYFVLRIALVLLALLVLVEAVAHVLQAHRSLTQPPKQP